jgi:hypothetical protein
VVWWVWLFRIVAKRLSRGEAHPEDCIRTCSVMGVGFSYVWDKGT